MAWRGAVWAGCSSSGGLVWVDGSPSLIITSGATRAGFLELLGQLTEVGDIPQADFEGVCVCVSRSLSRSGGVSQTLSEPKP